MNDDNIKNNIEKLLRNIDITIYNMEIAYEFINNTSDNKIKKELMERNRMREDTVLKMRKLIEDESNNISI